MVEYIIIIGIAVTVLYVMAPAFKRGVQSVIRGTADQLSMQENAEQDFTTGASFINSTTTAQNAQVYRNTHQFNTAAGYASRTDDRHYNAALTNTLTEMGFSQ